jgi:hypothetical protein
MYIEGLVLALPLVGVYLLFSPVRVSYVTVGEWRGVYYGIIFLERGFGISVGVHTAYDLLFLTLREVSLN